MTGVNARLRQYAQLAGLCLVAGTLVAGLLVPVVAGGGALFNRMSQSVASMAKPLVGHDMPGVTTLLDRSGQPLAYFYKDYRIYTPSNQIPDAMRAAIVAVEDKRFYNHGAVDFMGTLRAMAKDASGGSTQGASSITQQYVKNYLVSIAKTPAQAQLANRESIARKLREARMAVALERIMPKDQILTGYLNIVPFGNQMFGIRTAAQTYFHTTPSKLTIAQSALLAALVNQPGALDPVKHPSAALDRRNLVIDLMTDPHNSVRITKREAAIAKREPLGVVPPLATPPPNGCIGVGDSAINGFFCNYVESYLSRAGIDQERLRLGGYTVRTTMDRKATEAAAAAAKDGVPPNTNGIANAMAVVEPGSSQHKVRALVANRDYGNDPSKGQTAYDIVSKVQPFGAGSIYKLFTAAAAIERGMSIYDIVDVPPFYRSRIYTDRGNFYVVGNAEGVTPGPRTLQMALATSPNTAFVAMEEKVGLNNVVDMAYRMGLRTSTRGVNAEGLPLRRDGSNGPSLADDVKKNQQGAFTLGYTPTSVLELSNVAATIASHGVYCPPNPIEDIHDQHGRLVPLKPLPCQQVLSPRVADELAQGMSKDATQGTSAAAARAAKWNRPLMAKTGTTQQSQSAAFLGATPQMAGAVLVYADGSHPQGICDGGAGAPPYLCGENGNVYGGNVPARTWYQAMTKIHEGLPVAGLPDGPPPPE